MAERYPTFRAGQKVTGELLASMQPLTVRKASDTGRTSTTSTIDPELQLTVEANGVYVFRGILYVNNTTNTDDINIGWTTPTGSDGMFGGIGPAEDAATTTTTVRIIGTAITSTRNYGTDDAGAANPGIIPIDGDLIVGGTAGTFGLNWAHPTGTGTCTVYADSYITLTRIA